MEEVAFKLGCREKMDLKMFRPLRALEARPTTEKFIL